MEDVRISNDSLSGYYDQLSLYREIEKNLKNPSLYTSTMVRQYSKSGIIKSKPTVVKETRYVNLTGQGITVVDNLDQQLIIPPTDMCGLNDNDVINGVNYYKETKTFQVIETFQFRDIRDVELVLEGLRAKYERKEKFSEKETVLAHELNSYMKDITKNMNAVHTYSTVKGKCNIDIITHVKLDAFNDDGVIYLEEVGVHLLIGGIRPDFVHKNGMKNFINEKYAELLNISVKDVVIGSIMYLVDNNDFLGDRWVNIHGLPLKLPKITDITKDDGFYCSIIEGGVSAMKVIYYTFEEADMDLLIYKSKEEALANASGDDIFKREQLKLEIDRLKHKLELEKKKNEVEEEKNKRENASHERKDRYEQSSQERKDRYEERSHRRRDRTETIKNIGIAISTIASIYTIYKAFYKR